MENSLEQEIATINKRIAEIHCPELGVYNPELAELIKRLEVLLKEKEEQDGRKSN